jgi:hypothetical protein
MPGKRNARSRVRGSWAARLTGGAFAILLAGVGVAAYLIVGGAHADNSGDVLPTRVLATQAIGLVDAGPAQAAGANPAPQTLLASQADLSFRAVGEVAADWTADQMAGGTYIFIYLPNGLCLGSSSTKSGTKSAALQRCNLQAGQRWIRQRSVVGASGLDYWQLRNLALNRCLTAASVPHQAATTESAARLETCQAAPDWRQLIAFLTAS